MRGGVRIRGNGNIQKIGGDMWGMRVRINCLISVGA